MGGGLLRRSYHKWNVYAKFGLSAIINNASDESVNFDQQTRFQIASAVGGLWRFNAKWFARLELEAYDKDATLTNLSIGKYLGDKHSHNSVPKAIESGSTRVLERVVTKYVPVDCPRYQGYVPTIFFDTSLAALKRVESTKLKAFVAALKADKSVNIKDVFVELHGHTDSRASEPFNADLGYSRSQSVGRYLVRTGLSANNIRYFTSGENAPVLPNNSASNRAHNRRVEILINYKRCALTQPEYRQQLTERFISVPPHFYNENSMVHSPPSLPSSLPVAQTYGDMPVEYHQGQYHHSVDQHHHSHQQGQNYHQQGQSEREAPRYSSPAPEPMMSAPRMSPDQYGQPRGRGEANNNRYYQEEKQRSRALPPPRYQEASAPPYYSKDYQQQDDARRRYYQDSRAVKQPYVDGGGYQQDWRPTNDEYSNVLHPLTREPFEQLR